MANSWDHLTHYGDVPTQQEILTYTDILVPSARRTVISNPRPIAAAQGRRPRSRVKYWLADTGCGYDLVAKKHVDHVADRIKTAENSILFNTANGNTDATDDILLRVDEDIEPYVLESTPAVLSVGRRCQEYGYQFHWPASSSKPYFVTPKGKKIELTVQDHVPYLKQNLQNPQ